MDFTFDVGKTEPHKIRLSTTRFNGKVTLAVDGRLVKEETFRFWIPLRRHYEILVGDSEQHQIAIEMQFARMSRKFAEPDCTAYIDGEQWASTERLPL